jgi:hypothetical protein
MSKIKSNQITSRAHKGTLVIGDTHDKVQFHHEAEVFIPGYATKEYVDDVAANVMPHENPVFHLNDAELFVDYQIPAGKNAGTFGPLATKANVNVPEGSTWTIVGEDDITAHAGYLRDLADTDIPMVPNDDSFLHYDAYTDKWKPKTLLNLVGDTGEQGASAYEVAVENGFVGTEEQWLDSLVGPQGEAFTYDDFTKEQLNDLQGPIGETGEGGQDGEDGQDGKGWKAEGTAYDSETGKVSFASDDGLGFTTGDLRGEKGAPGDGIHVQGSVDSEADLPSSGNEVGDGYIDNTDGDLWIWGDDDKWHDVGHVQGPDGPQGDDGLSSYEVWLQTHPNGSESEYWDSLQGATGPGWTGGSYSSADGKVTFTSNDGLGFSTGDVRGEDGEDGDDNFAIWLENNPGGTKDEFWAEMKGDTGEQGPMKDVVVGTTTSLAPTSDNELRYAYVRSSALTSHERLVLDFGIPQGKTGEMGPPGTNGSGAYETYVEVEEAAGRIPLDQEEWLETLVGPGFIDGGYKQDEGTVWFEHQDPEVSFETEDLRGHGWSDGYYTDETGVVSFKSDTHPYLDFDTSDLRGHDPVVDSVETETLDPGSDATVEVVSNVDNDLEFSFGIPEGLRGEPGPRYSANYQEIRIGTQSGGNQGISHDGQYTVTVTRADEIDHIHIGNVTTQLSLDLGVFKLGHTMTITIPTTIEWIWRGFTAKNEWDDVATIFAAKGEVPVPHENQLCIYTLTMSSDGLYVSMAEGFLPVVP